MSPPEGPEEEAAQELILAVDAGASKTDAWIVHRSGALLGTAQGEGANHQFSGMDGAMEALSATAAAALEDAGCDPSRKPAVGTGVYCMAGMDFPVDEEHLGEAIEAQALSRHHLLFNDTLAVFRAGSRSGWGIGVVCGSGLNCVGRGPDGAIERFPSLAELSGDFAPGGSWLGVRALGLALRARDGRGGPTQLTDRVAAHFGMADPESVLQAVYTGVIPYNRLFELARLCLDAADAGDAPSIAAADFLADEVVAMITAIVNRLQVQGDDVEVVLGGGLFDSTYRGFSARVESGVRQVAPRAVFRRLDGAPVLGAALLGLDAVGTGAEAADQLRADAPTGSSERSA
jgi:N-acetylglucosamine kinase-like BadF-type ATPase